jgi:spermidine synthase
MLTNGKFQGNNANEIHDQRLFAIIPSLFVKEPKRALNVGLGTGCTLGALAKLPYREIEVAELSADIVDAAHTYFADIGAASLDDPRVKVHLEDGRNLLQRRRGSNPFDLISIEITSIWFAGAGNLYNDEFYRLVNKNLTPGGVLQQWIQLHHMGPRDIGVVLKTLRAHFAHVQLWLPGHQGILVASNEPLVAKEARITEAVQGFQKEEFPFGEPLSIFGSVLLGTEQIDAFLKRLDQSAPLATSTDDNLWLEYSTPRGSALGWNFTSNLEKLTEGGTLLPSAVVSESMRTPKFQAASMLGSVHRLEKYSDAWHARLTEAIRGFPPDERAELKSQVQRRKW